MHRKRKCLTLFTMIICLFLSPVSKIDVSAQESVLLATYNAGSHWFFSVDPQNAQTPAPSIGVSESGVVCTMNFGMQYNVYLGQIDLSKATPTHIEVVYSQGATQNELINWSQIYIVLGENENSIPTRWWAGPYHIRSTGSWENFASQTFVVTPGTSLEWPDTVTKVWLHNSRVADLHVTQVNFYGVMKLQEGDGNGTEGDGDSGSGNAPDGSDDMGNGGEETNDATAEDKPSEGDNSSDSSEKDKTNEKDTSKSKTPENEQSSEKTEKLSVPEGQRVYLAKISVSGEPNKSSGSVGGGDEKEKQDSLVVKKKYETDKQMMFTTLAAILFFLFGALTKYVNFKINIRRN